MSEFHWDGGSREPKAYRLRRGSGTWNYALIVRRNDAWRLLIWSDEFRNGDFEPFPEEFSELEVAKEAGIALVLLSGEGAKCRD